MLSDLDLRQWRGFDLSTARSVAGEVAGAVGGQLLSIETVEHLGAPLHRVRIDRDGQEFALVPGGAVELGFDPDDWQPTTEQIADFEESVEGEFTADTTEPREYLRLMLSPRRSVTVPTLLVAVLDEHLSEVPAEMPAVLAARGLRLPTPDEWEHACGAGANTLFWWGDEIPLEDDPYGDLPLPELNAFGLRIAYDAYRCELTSDPASVYGGDGGEAVCGGYGGLLSWLPLATANRNPWVAEMVHGPDGEYAYEAFSVRAVLAV